MTPPRISIITPSFNQSQFIEGTIRSVIDQNYSNLEYIIIDGKSTDSTTEIIKKYENNITYWVSEQDKGQSNAINKGIQKATGEIIAWLNSDDQYLPDTFNSIATLFMQNPDVDVIYGDVENIFPDGKKELYSNKFNTIEFLGKVSIHQPSVFWRRKLHDQIGDLDESLHYLMDYDLWMRLFFRYKTLKIPKTLSKFRVHPNSKTGTNPNGLYLEYRKIISLFINSINYIAFKNKLLDLNLYDNPLGKNYTITAIPNSKEIKCIINNYIYNCGVQEYSFGHAANANHLLFESIKAKPLPSFYFIIKNYLRYLWQRLN